MYGEIFYYNLDGSLRKTTIEQFKTKHSRCVRHVRNVTGMEIEVRSVPAMVENYVFIECCDEKFFFNLYNAKVNLKERLLNFQKIESLRVGQMISRDVFSKISNISYANNLLREMDEIETRGYNT